MTGKDLSAFPAHPAAWEPTLLLLTARALRQLSERSYFIWGGRHMWTNPASREGVSAALAEHLPKHRTHQQRLLVCSSDPGTCGN